MTNRLIFDQPITVMPDEVLVVDENGKPSTRKDAMGRDLVIAIDRFILAGPCSATSAIALTTAIKMRLTGSHRRRFRCQRGFNGTATRESNT